MPVIDFPSSPTNGQIFTDGDHTWIFSAISAGGPGAWKLQTQSTTGPTGPTGATGAAGTGGATGPTGATGSFALAQTVEDKTADYTLLTADVGKLITVTSATAKTITVNGTLDLSVGQRIDLLQMGAGQVTVSGSGATVNGTPGLKLRAQYSGASLVCTAADTYVLVGDLTA